MGMTAPRMLPRGQQIVVRPLQCGCDSLESASVTNVQTTERNPAMKSALTHLAGVGYVAMLIAQFIAIWDGIGAWWGIKGILRIIAVLFIDAVPLLGQITGVVGAHDCWGWGWTGAILLFFWPIALILVAGLFSKNEH